MVKIFILFKSVPLCGTAGGPGGAGGCSLLHWHGLGVGTRAAAPLPEVEAMLGAVLQLGSVPGTSMGSSALGSALGVMAASWGRRWLWA